MNLSQYDNDLLFLPLGGSSEIGMNLNLYRYKGKWLVVDCGSGFADESLPGVDMIAPDLKFLIRNKENVVGLVLTHAHEDHIGSVRYFCSEIQCPIYTTTFTANFLKVKLGQQAPHIDYVEIGAKFEIAPFQIDMINLTHSAPEMQALVIKAGEKTVLHTGDWKLDHDPLVGEVSNEAAIKSYGDQGIDAIVCDSTNVFKEGHSGSEGDLRKSLLKIVKEKCTGGMTVMSTFASNIARIDTLMHVAKELKKRVVIAGKSIDRIMEAAQSSGYLNDVNDIIISAEQISSFPRNDIIVIATGCQGEPNAAVSRMATESHDIRLCNGDTIIFSSKIIPGSERRIFNLFNLLVKKKVEIITEEDHFVHVSGHPNVEELRKMYQLSRPKMAIPVHGEAVHIHQHAKLAKSFGVQKTFEPENGMLINISSQEVIGKEHSGYMGINGKILIPISSDVFKVRRKIRDNGSVFVNLVYQNYKLAKRPSMVFPGALDDVLHRDMLEDIRGGLYRELTRSSSNAAERTTIKFVQKYFKNIVGKVPMIFINIERL
jgi:ribonuclease J